MIAMITGSLSLGIRQRLLEYEILTQRKIIEIADTLEKSQPCTLAPFTKLSVYDADSSDDYIGGTKQEICLTQLLLQPCRPDSIEKDILIAVVAVLVMCCKRDSVSRRILWMWENGAFPEVMRFTLFR